MTTGTTLTEDRRTSLVIDPPDGRIPRKGRGGPGRQFARFFNRPDSYEDRIAQERCIMYTTTPVHSQFNSNLLQLFQTPDVVVIHYEANHDVRVVPLDGRPHLPNQIRQLHGDSRGHWEGETLVVETTNFRDEYNFQGAGAQYRLVERFTRVGADRIDYEYTVEDPDTFTQAWTALLPLKRTEEALYEYACHEGNRGLALILEGARAEDVADQFAGTYGLASYVTYDADGTESPTSYDDGIIMYDAGRMSVHLMNNARATPGGGPHGSGPRRPVLDVHRLLRIVRRARLQGRDRASCRWLAHSRSGGDHAGQTLRVRGRRRHLDLDGEER